MSVAVIEQEPQLTVPTAEVYGESLAAHRLLGRIAISQSVDVALDSNEAEHAFDDYRTSIEEGLITDKELKDVLYFNSPSEHRLLDNRVVARNGQFMSDLVYEGAQTSLEAAEEDPRLEPLAIRDQGDVMIAEAVDTLKRGEMLRVTSMDPKKQLTGEDKQRWIDMGLRIGLAVEQVYYRTEDDRLLTWAIAIRNSSKSAISRVYEEELGINIPIETDENLWSRYVHRSFATEEEVIALNHKIRNRHKELIGDTQPEISVTNFLDRNDSMRILQTYFRTYVIPLSIAVESGDNQYQIKELAKMIFTTATDVKEEDRKHLFKIANKDTFNSDDGRLMNRMLRSATIEKLRKNINSSLAKPYDKSSSALSRASYAHTYVQPSPQFLHQELAMSIQAGAKEKRSYGGCAASSVTEDNETSDSIMSKLQDVFGGNGQEEERSNPEGRDGRGPLKFQCKKGHWNKRKDFQPDIEKCQHSGCNEKVGCKPNDSLTEVTRLSDWIIKKSTAGSKVS